MIVCIGEALIDLVVDSHDGLKSGSFVEIQAGGAPLNVAIGLSRLGVPSGFLGALSSDAFGDLLSRLFDAEDIVRIPTERVCASTRLAVIDHSNDYAPFRFYGSDTSDTRLTRDHVDAALRGAEVTGIYMGSLPFSDPNSCQVAEYAVELAVRSGVPVFTDPNPRPAVWTSQDQMVDTTAFLLRNSTLAKISLDDAVVLGWPTEPVDVLRHCRECYGATVIVTGGARGCWAEIDGAVAHVRPPEIEPVDPTGAGDASFAAAISRFVDNGFLTATDVQFAATAGALATRTKGTTSSLPTLNEVISHQSDSR